MSLKPKFSKKALTVIIMLCVIGAGYAYYFLGYVKSNEIAYQEKAFRILDKIGNNIEGTQKNNIKYVKNLKKEDINNLLSNPSSNKKIKKEFSLASNSNQKGIDSLLYTTKSQDIKGQNIDLKFKMSVSDFIKPLLREDVFDEFIILSNGSEKIAYQTFNNKLILQKKDSLFHKYSTKNKTIIVGKTKYIVFTYNLLFDNNQMQWLIAGCVKEKNYLKEIRSINFWIIINSSLIIVLLIFAMPILKLALMNSIERLHRTNVFLTGISIIMGTLFISLLFLIGNNYRHDIAKTDVYLENLSLNVKHKIGNELEATYKQLISYDSIFNDSFTKTKLKRDSIYLSNVSVANDTNLFYPKYYKNFNTVFWTNKDGMQKAKLFPNTKTTKSISIKGRDYFSAAIQDTLWHLPKTGRPFYMQSIITWTTGKRQIAISTRGKDKKQYPVVALTAVFKSMVEPIIPMGYGFSIITKEGEVLIDSNSSKNLQENFIDESKNSAELRSAIYSRIARTTNVNYLGRNHRVKIEPIKGTPLFLIVHYDLSNLKSKISEIWSTSLIFTTNSLLFVGLLIFIIHVGRKRTSILLTKQFFFSWMAPKEYLLQKYKKLIYFNLLISIFIVVYFNFSKAEKIEHIVFLLFIPLVTFIIAYFTLKNSFKDNKPNPGNFKKIYTYFLCSWLFVSTILPVVYTYKAFYIMESKIWSKYTLLEFSKNIENQIKRNKNNNPKSIKNLIDISSNHNSYEGIYNNFLNIQIHNNTDGFDSISASMFDDNFFNLRPNYNDIITKSKGLVYPNSEDSLYTWKQRNNEILLQQDLYIKKGNTKIINISQQIQPLEFHWSKYNNMGIFIIPLIIVSLLFIRFVISFCVEKIYGLEFKKISDNEKITKEIMKTNNTILIGLPSSGKTTFIKNTFKNGTSYLLINCTTINHKTKEGAFISDAWNFENYETIILDNFEYDNDDHDTNTKKLRMLEKLQNLNKHIVITSEIETTEILDMYNKAFIKAKNNEDSKREYEDDLEIWRHIFSNFIEVYKPLLKKVPKVIVNEQKKNPSDNVAYLKDLANELKQSSFLHKIAPIMLKKVKGNFEHEVIILEIQNYSKSYYYALWNALTEKEKYAIFDMAKDDFINTKNKQVLNILLKKGLLVYENNRLNLMNESFKNFILSVLTSTEIKKMDSEVRNKGKWVNIKLAIILVIISLIILIGFGKPDFFKNMNAIMIALAGVMTVVPTLSRAFTLTQKIK